MPQLTITEGAKKALYDAKQYKESYSETIIRLCNAYQKEKTE